MHAACGRNKKCTKNVWQKTQREETTWKSRQNWDDSIRMDPREIGWEVVDQIHVAQDMDQQQAPTDMAMKP